MLLRQRLTIKTLNLPLLQVPSETRVHPAPSIDSLRLYGIDFCFHVVGASAISHLAFPSRLYLRQGDQCGEEHAERGPGLLREAVREEAERQAQELHAAGGQRGERWENDGRK